MGNVILIREDNMSLTGVFSTTKPGQTEKNLTLKSLLRIFGRKENYKICCRVHICKQFQKALIQLGERKFDEICCYTAVVVCSEICLWPY